MIRHRKAGKNILILLAAGLSVGCNVFVLSTAKGESPNPAVSDPSARQLAPPDFPNARIDAFAGTGSTGNGVSDDALRCALRQPSETVVNSDGSLFIADRGNDQIRLVKDGKISVFPLVLSDDKAIFRPRGLFRKDDALYISDAHRIYKVDATTGACAWTANGLEYDEPDGIAVDSQKNVYFSTAGNKLIRRWSPSTCKLDTFASTPLQYPMGLAIDKNDSLYVADRANHRINRLDQDDNATIVAGTGKSDLVAGAGMIANLGTFDGDGQLATCKSLNQPTGVAVDRKGNVFIADSLNQRVRVVVPDGKIYTLAGTGKTGDTGDGGPAFCATFGNPIRVSLDPEEKILYVSDDYAHRVRKITLNP